jgi:hypothetical protein
MVYNTRNQSDSGLYPSSYVLTFIKQSVSDTGSVSVLMQGNEIPTLLGPLERANFNPIISNLKTERHRHKESTVIL